LSGFAPKRLDGRRSGPPPQDGFAQHQPGPLVITPKAALAGGRKLDGGLVTEGGVCATDRRPGELEEVRRGDWTDELNDRGGAAREPRGRPIKREAHGSGRAPVPIVYAAIGKSRACSISRRNSGSGARHMVRYVSRKGSQFDQRVR
jgi:hypothetical protein